MWYQKPPLGTPLDWGNPLNDEAVLAFAMNEGHGDKVEDLSLNGNHGTLKNFAFPPTATSGWNLGEDGIGLKSDGVDDYIEVDSMPAPLSDFTMISVDDYNPVIPVGGGGDWDENIREIGNIIYDVGETDASRRYKTFYSGYIGAYAGNNVYVGYAYSPDGINWTKFGKVIARSLEDPYVVKSGSTYHLYAEDKADVPFKNIRKYHSSDCESWVDDGDVFDPQAGGAPADWEATDVSSPVVWIEGSTWYLLYEGRGGGFGGKVGLATSTDGINWTRDGSNPVFDAGAVGEWDETNIVSDDISKVGSTYYMLYHGYGSSGPTGFWPGMATATSLTSWARDARNPIIKAAPTAMFVNDAGYHFFAEEASGIVRSAPRISQLNLNDEITISVLMKAPPSAITAGILSNKSAAEWGDHVGYSLIMLSDGRLLGRIGNKQAYGNRVIDDDEPHCCIMVWSADNDIKMYIDGREVTYTVQESATTIGGTATNLKIGVYHDVRWFGGLIDQPRITNRVWSAKEIKDYTINPWQVYLDE
jgi:predicted GH43/DUF377 family glycosyl hydrolase